MRRCAFLTTYDLGELVEDDHLAIKPLHSLGWKTDTLPWNAPNICWEEYDIVVIRSTWDYHANPSLFLDVLSEIESSGTRLANPASLVAWNFNKNYLKELENAGVPIVPTVWMEHLDPDELPRLVDQFADGDTVMKPVVGASANGVFRTNSGMTPAQKSEIEQYFADTPLMAQPLATFVLTEGEYSLFYFNGVLSHTVLKTPKQSDFRVQDELGGTSRLVEAEQALQESGDRVMSVATANSAESKAPLYARVDLIRSNDGDGFWLIELELIEPSLFLREDPLSPARFARAIDAYAQ